MSRLRLNLYTNLHRTKNNNYMQHLQKLLKKSNSSSKSVEGTSACSFKDLFSRSVVPKASSTEKTIKSFFETTPIKLNIDNNFHEQMIKLAKERGLKVKDVSSKKTPRFLYHLTTKENYFNMLQTGKINPSSDNFCGQNIFMFDIMNFLKRWTKQYEGGLSSTSIDKKLFCKMVGKKDSSVVLLRIPTKNMNIEKLSIRSQDSLFTAGDHVLQYQKFLLDKYKCSTTSELLEIVKNDENAFIEVFDWYKKARHLSLGAPAGMNKLFTQRKHALEYIFPDCISTKDISLVGEIDSSKLDFNTTSIKDIFEELLQNQPEKNCLRLLG